MASSPRRRLLAWGGVAAVAAGAFFLTYRTPMPLAIDDRTLAALRAFRAEPKFLDLPGVPAARERARLEPLFDDLADRLIAGIRQNPTDAWVFDEMTPTVDAFHLEDTEARERCVDYIARLFKILGIQSDRRVFARFLIFV
jgi:hypothetical protein